MGKFTAIAQAAKRGTEPEAPLQKFEIQASAATVAEPPSILPDDDNDDDILKELQSAGVPVREMDPADLLTCRWQPENRYTESDLQSLMSSIESVGQLEPSIAWMPDDRDGMLELLSGHQRKEAISRLGRTLKVIVLRGISQLQAYEVFVATNLQRKDPNEIQEMDFVLAYLGMRFGISKSQVASAIYSAFNSKQRNSKFEIPGSTSCSEEDFMTAYSQITRLGINTFRSKRLIWNSAPPEIQAEFRKGTIDAKAAKALIMVPDDEDRKLLLNQVLAGDLPISDLQEQAKALKEQSKGDRAIAPEVALPKLVRNSLGKISSNKAVFKDPEKVKELETLCRKFDEAVSNLLDG